MSVPDKPISKQRRQTAQPEHQKLPKDDARSEPGVDCFAAAFVAARGTVSSELDLSGVLDEPVVMGDDADAGPRRPGA